MLPVANPDSQHPQLDLGMVQSWLETLLGDAPGLLHVCSTGNWSGLACQNAKQAASYVATQDLRQANGIYLRATTLKGPLAPGSRGSEDDSQALPGLWADLDIAGPGHRTDKPLPPSEADARKVIEVSGLPTPTLWIRSGGGLYPWWLLTAAFELGVESELEAAQGLSRGWQHVIGQAATRLGWHYGTEVADLSRVLRIPGTVNRKVDGQPRMCTFAEGGNGHQYTFEQLLEALETVLRLEPPPEPLREARVAVLLSGPSQPGDPVRPGDALESQPWGSELLLGGASWEVHHVTGDTTYWTRPGKDRRDGWSATTGHSHDRDRLFVFSSSTPFEPYQAFTKFGAYAVLHHGGDYKAAAKALAAEGFGDRLPEPTRPDPMKVPTNEQVVDGQPVEPEWRRFSWDDMGNADRFTSRYGDVVRRVVDSRMWAVYGDGHWELDHGELATARGCELVNELPRLEGNLVSDPEEFNKWVSKQRSDSKIKAMMSLARSQPRLTARMDDFDRDPMVLNCRNGTLDLKTGQLMPHEPTQLLMGMAGTDWNEDTRCPRWLAFLERCQPDPLVREYLQRVAGYCLTGYVSERAMFIHFGGTTNGKTVFMEVLADVLGGYSITISSKTLLSKKWENSANEDVARMKGRRLMQASETNVGKYLDEAQVKLLTGGDTVNARYLYKGSFDFRPTGKMHLVCNHIPAMSNADSTWRRLSIIEWGVTIPDEEIDTYLASRIVRSEASGVLGWMVQGCLKWQREGLAPPPSVLAYTQAYREQQDPVGQFVAERLKPTTTREHLESSTTIYGAYQGWCQENGERAMSGKALTMALKEHGLEHGRNMYTRGFYGIRAISPNAPQQLPWNLEEGER